MKGLIPELRLLPVRAGVTADGGVIQDSFVALILLAGYRVQGWLVLLLFVFMKVVTIRYNTQDTPLSRLTVSTWNGLCKRENNQIKSECSYKAAYSAISTARAILTQP